MKVEPQQEAGDDMYYVWLYEGSQVMRKVYAALALVVIFTVVLYPLWPLVLRQGVYYLSWGFLGLLGLFFLMAIFRVILFCVTYFAVSPGLWLYPNLWEDVSFMDSFRPVWAWHEVGIPHPATSMHINRMVPRKANTRIIDCKAQEEEEEGRDELRVGCPLRRLHRRSCTGDGHDDGHGHPITDGPATAKRLPGAAGRGARRRRVGEAGAEGRRHCMALYRRWRRPLYITRDGKGL